MDNYTVPVVLRPEGWGKSTNADMLRKFFEIEVDNKGERLPEENRTNHKLFLGGDVIINSNNDVKTLKTLKISNSSKSLQYLGNCPVILVKMKNAIGGSFEEIENNMKSCISEAFKSHDYLLHSSRITDKETFSNYSNGIMNTIELEFSIFFLSQKLHEHFSTKVNIIIDDYDIPIINAHLSFSSNVRQMDRFQVLIRRIYNTTFNHNPYRNHGLVNGVVPAVELQVFAMPPVPVYDWRRKKPPFIVHYGLTPSEVIDRGENLESVAKTGLREIGTRQLRQLRALKLTCLWVLYKRSGTKKRLLITLTLVIFKLGITSSNSPFKITQDTDDFQTLLLNNDLFVDKSLLIEEFLDHMDNYTVPVVLRPEGWGKSTNADMLRKFFEIEVDNKGNKKRLLITLTLVIFKLGITSSNSPFKITQDTNDFQTLLLNNDLYVDKSLLIEEFLDHMDNYTVPVVLRPEGWGKSTNADMLRKFFEIEVDTFGERLPKENRTNHKLFLGGDIIINSNNDVKTLKPLKISNSSKSLQYLGNCPVIMVKMKNAIGSSFEETENNVKLCVSEAFKSHDYLLHSSRITDKEKFSNYSNGIMNTTDLTFSIVFLSQKLHEHFSTKVHIIIDDFDIPMIHAHLTFSQNLRHMNELELSIRRIYDVTLKNNPCRSVGLVSGVIPPVKSRVFVLELINVHHLMRKKPPFFDYYGLTRPEVEDKLTKVPIKLDPGQISSWYGGYSVFGPRDFYNTRSVIRCLTHNGTLQYYGSDSKITTLVDEFLLSDDRQQVIQELIVENSYQIFTTRSEMQQQYIGVPLCSCSELYTSPDT
ncbi:hypothetical protein U1Q18_049813 [Sarracenia purpurea var. burkii]